MCGIAGFIGRNGADRHNRLADIARNMGGTMRHRGPDADDIWTDENAAVGLAHRRLSVIDLSAAGNQPMVTKCGRFVIVYNGEIYNAIDLRIDLEKRGRQFRGDSDTEVILEACATWGVERAVASLNGMFAFALWDRDTRQLALVRDRLGIKPIYWAKFSGVLMFASELKAMRAHPDWVGEINRDAVATYLRRNFISAPLTIYRGVFKLPAGHMILYNPRRSGDVQTRRYWSLDDAVERGRLDPVGCAGDNAAGQLEALLSDAVRRRMIADVPLGALLSGGIDSSMVVALMQAQSNRPIRSFSIGFEEDGYNEAPHAAAVARHLGTDHTELYVTSEQARDVIPALPDIYDEPFADWSQIPTYLVSALTRQHVTVALSGDGGDELFGGYLYYRQAQLFTDIISRLPEGVRTMASSMIRRLPTAALDRLSRLLPGRAGNCHAGELMQKLALVLCETEQEFHLRKQSHWQDPGRIALGAMEPPGLFKDPAVSELVPNLLDRMQYVDTLTYLPEDILTKVDRASMAVSLEVRVPLLDHRVVEFAWRVPRKLKIRFGVGKWLLRQVLYQYVPRSLIDRPKMGFSVPLDAWLRGPLRNWAEELLNPAAINKFGLLEPEPVWSTWQEHISGEHDLGPRLWSVLMLQSWCDQQSQHVAGVTT